MALSETQKECLDKSKELIADVAKNFGWSGGVIPHFTSDAEISVVGTMIGTMAADQFKECIKSHSKSNVAKSR